MSRLQLHQCRFSIECVEHRFHHDDIDAAFDQPCECARLGAGQTLQVMQTEYIYPEVGDRSSPKEWAEQGSLDILQRAQQRTQEILSQHYPQHIDAALDDKIRAALPIKLPREQMWRTA